MNAGDIQTRRQVTGKIHLQPASAGGYISSGNIGSIDTKIDVKRTAILVARKGYRAKQQDLINELAWEYEAKQDEHFGGMNELLYLGTKAADAVQALVTAPTGTASFVSIALGRTYFLGKYNVNTVIVQVSAVTKTVDVDYTLDAGAGSITILPSGTIADAATVSVTFGCAAVTMEPYSTQDVIYTYGACRIELFDQHSEVPVEVHTFSAQWYVTDRGSNDGSKVNEYTLHILAQTKPVIVIRK